MKLRLLLPIAALAGATLFAPSPAPAQAAACTHVDGLVPLYICIPPKA